jgi:uncharacterized protein (TIGR03437 family)
LNSNQSATCTVNLDKGSVGTTTVTLSDDSAQLVTPGNVAIGNGLSSASFNVTATVISLSQTATVAASLNGVNRSATVSLVAPAGLSGLSCSPKAFSTAGSAACTVTLVGASVGNTTIALSEGSANVTVPDSVTVLNGQNSAQFAATVTGVPADETVVIAAGLNGGTQTTSLSLTAPVVLTSLSCAPGSLTNGQSATCTVSLSKAAAGGVVIGLSGGSAALTVPANVTVANGAASGAFSITAGTVASNQTATVSASLNGVTKSALVNLTAPAVPAALTSIQCAPASLNSNQSATCTVNLDKSSNGVTTLTLSDDNAQLTTPGNLAIGNGASSASFTVAATAISLSQTATVTASLSGVTKSFPVILTAPVVPASLVSILCAPSSLNSNQSATCTVTLDKSLDGIASVALSDNSAQLATPGGVSIDKNASSASFNVTTGGISFSQTVTVAASLNGVNRSTTVSLIAPAGLSGLNCSPSTFTAAGSATCTVTLAGAAAGNTVIGLSEGSANVTVPGAVTVIGGQSSAQFTASVTGIPADEAVALTAALNGGTQTTTLTLSAPATLLSLTCAPGSLKSGENATCVATLNSPSKGGTSVSLSSDNALLKGPSLIAIPNGASSASFPVTAGTIVSSQTATLSAALNGITRTSQISLAAPAVITLSSLNCSPNSFNLAGTAACTVTLSAPVLSNTLVALSTSGTGVSVSGTVTVLAGTKEAQFSAAVSAVQADTTGTITAALNGTTRSANLTLKAPAAEVTVLSSLTCSPEALKNNQSSTCTVTLTKPSTGGVTLTLADDNAALNTPLNVAVAPGASTASFGVSVGKIASNQTASVTASWGGSAQTAHIHLEFTASAAPGSAALSSLVCNPTSIAAGGSTLCVVTLSSPADATAVGLASSSDQLALPATVNVPPAAASAQFRVNIPASAPPQQVVLTATLAAISQTARLAITAAGPAPGASQLTSLACSPSHLAPGETSVCTVYLKDLAGASISPTVAASSPNLVVPATVDFPVGSKSQSFNAVASPALSTAQSVDVTVTHDGHTVTTRLDLNLGSAEPTLTSLDCSTASLASGSGAVCVVTLKSAAPFASEISLSSSDALLQVPSRTSIGTGATNVSFAVQAGTTDVPRSVTLSASWNGRSPVTKVLQVKPHTITLNAPSSVFTREPVPVGFDVKATHSAGLATSITAPSLPKGAVLRGSRFTWTPSANEVGEYPVLFRATDDTGLAATATTRVVVRPAKPVIQGLYNPAGYSAIDSCSPHAIVTFLGSGFSLHDPTEATSTPWPTELAGVRIRINGIYAPITYVSDTTVHFQCPAFKPGESLQIVMEYESVSSLSPNVTGAVSTTSTAPVVARMDDAAPGIYQLNGSQAAALISGTGLVAGPPIGGITGEGYPSRFVVPGEYLEIYANGLGETSGSLLPGEPAPLDQLLRAAGPITAVFEDGKRVIADFAGLTPGSVGLFQINVLVPAGVVLGDAVPLYLELKRPDGSVLRSNTVTIAVGR